MRDNTLFTIENPKIAIIGLGYVGLPLAAEFGRILNTIGFDINTGRIQELRDGHDSTLEVSDEQLAEATQLTYTDSKSDIADANIYIITVPTPIDATNTPDLNPIRSATETVRDVLSNGDLVIYESTVYPGVTEEVCVPILEASGLRFNTDFFCGYSPERINPGDKVRTLTTIQKITSGSTPEVADFVDELYRRIITAGTFKASSIKVAEAAKVIENTQRDVNIALINELALIFDSLGINSHEVLDAAATKWNFINLRPGLVGGHCIGVDPYYLTYKAEEMGYVPNLILQSRQINNGMTQFIVDKTIKLMIEKGLKIRDANMLVLGLTFKENCPDIRNSKVFDLIRQFEEYHCNVTAYDPWVVSEIDFPNPIERLETSPFDGKARFDVIVGAVAHQEFAELTPSELRSVLKPHGLIIDIKNVLNDKDWSL